MVVIRKMKEKCKDAARKRREKERAEFVELSKLLPLPSSVTNQLDKASIIRLTSSYLRMRTAFPKGLGENWGTKERNGRANQSGEATDSPTPAKTYRSNDCGQMVAVPNNRSSSVSPRTSSHQQHYIRELGSLILQTLDGFVFALHRDGKIMYISETVSVLLGLPQIDLTGSSVFEYVDPADHNEILNVLNLTDAERDEIAQRACGLNYGERDTTMASGESAQEKCFVNDEHCIELSRSFCMRMKCILPKRNAGLVSNGYKAIHCSGYLKVRRQPRASKQDNTLNSSSSTLTNTNKRTSSGSEPVNQEQHRNQQDHHWESYALVAVGHSLLPTASTEIKLGTSTFMFRANLDLKLYYIEAPVIKLFGYQQVELVGQSLYQFVHVADLAQLEQAHKQLLDKGQAVSKYYRLMRRNGGSMWVQTFATLVNNPRSMPKPQHIVGICHVIGTDQSNDSRSIVMNEQKQIKTHSIYGIPIGGADESHKLPNNSYSQLLRPSLQINMDDSLLAQSRQVDKQTTKRPRKQVVQQQQPKGASFQGKKQEIVDLRCNQLQGSPLYSENNPFEKCSMIGSVRRASEDACSVVSSIASASVSTSSGYSSNMSVLSSCPHSSSSSSSLSCSSSLSQNESIITVPAFSYTPEANATTPFQYYSQAQTPNGASQYQQKQIPSAIEDGTGHPEVAWIMPTTHHSNLSSSIDAPNDQAKKNDRWSVDNTNHASYDAQDLRWKAAATSPSTTIMSPITSSIATNPNSADSQMIGQLILSPERTYLNDQLYHTSDEQPMEDGYYHDCAVPIYFDGKCIQTIPYTDTNNSLSHSYQTHYASSQGTVCLSGSTYM